MDKIREEAERKAKSLCGSLYHDDGGFCFRCKGIAGTLEILMRDKAELEKKLEAINGASNYCPECVVLTKKLIIARSNLIYAQDGFQQMRDCKYEPDKLLCIQERNSFKIKQALKQLEEKGGDDGKRD